MAKIDELLETIDTLTVVELAELVKGIEEKSSVRSIVKVSQVVENAKLPGALSDQAKEKHDKIWNEVKLSN